MVSFIYFRGIFIHLGFLFFYLFTDLLTYLLMYLILTSMAFHSLPNKVWFKNLNIKPKININFFKNVT